MKIVPLLIAVAGVILLIAGTSSYLVKSGSAVACEACGMEITKDDVSTLRIDSNLEEPHWACCPVCAMVMALHYENVTLQGHCFSCAENITIECIEGNITSITPSSNAHNVSMLFGMSCMKNKLTCSNECADIVRTEYEWASGLPTKTLDQTFSTAEMKYSQFTVGYKPIEVPAITYGMIASGVALLAVAPLEYVLVEKKKTGEGQ